MLVKWEDLLTVGFSGSLFGYDRKEVDECLDAAAETMRTLELEKEELLNMAAGREKELDALKAKIETLEKEIRTAKETSVPGKAQSRKDEKAPVRGSERKNGDKRRGENKRAEAESEEPASPSRHLYRGTGEHSKRSASAFLHPHPFVEEEECNPAPETSEQTAEVDRMRPASGITVTVSRSEAVMFSVTGNPDVSAEAPEHGAPCGPASGPVSIDGEGTREPAGENPDRPEAAD